MSDERRGTGYWSVVMLAACDGSISDSQQDGGGGAGGNVGGGPGGMGGGGGSGSDGGGGGPPGNGPIDLCAGLVQDKQPHPMTALAQPAVGQAVTDAEFNTRIRRITQVAATGGSPALRPLYSTVSAWNAD